MWLKRHGPEIIDFKTEKTREKNAHVVILCT